LRPPAHAHSAGHSSGDERLAVMPDGYSESGPDAGTLIRVAIVESRPIFSIGLLSILSREADIDIVGDLRWEDDLAAVDDVFADVLVVDLQELTPPTDDNIRRLARAVPDKAVITIGRDHDSAYMMAAMEFGAAAHLGERAKPEELLQLIRRVAGGERPIRDELLRRAASIDRLMGDLQEALDSRQPPTFRLTLREMEVLRLVARGMRNQDVARSLGVSEQTIKNHMSAVRRRLGVKNRWLAVAYARRQGWLGKEAP
jgi:DNA-binding NarL/FixJ family response regulator